ncbi:hypothetical protein N8I77_005697 [Diaporthe amygdali]|uniref:Protein ZIP4 homolog n=1 Tax=Phomopsis amygdali TaxID=1214568 RepID=A0AAD9W303_PHOAM|nr:hypothetical protein N8I77_005697 [Diaporthe amygdali]
MADDQASISERDSRPTPTQAGSGDGDRARTSTSASSDKDSSKAHSHAPEDANKQGPQKKRRKVTHACVYCRRSRNIGHLCHDEPREHDTKKARGSTAAGSTMDETESQSDIAHSALDQTTSAAVAAAMSAPSFDGGAAAAAAAAGITAGAAGSLGRGNSIQLVRPTQLSGMQASGLGRGNMNQFAGFSDAWLTAQNHLQDVHSYQSNYLMAPEVSNEFNLLNEFLNSSLLDDGGLLSSDLDQGTKTQSDMLPGYGLNQNNLLPPSALPTGSMPPPADSEQGAAVARPAATTNPEDKKRREAAEFYLQVADPSGNDMPEKRMERVLLSKYEAGLLRPFNYIQGYKRLMDYLESHIHASSKQKILAQINRFRPKFREKVQQLTDIQLVYVEMWFERTLMEYDRVFASMAVPACCWRRTGEIFRGNKEMAELIGVQVEDLRDGNIALHQILTEASVVRYWEEFGTIAFDPSHDTLLTACELKCPIDDGKAKTKSKEIKCCFSLKIRRDDAKIGTRTEQPIGAANTLDCTLKLEARGRGGKKEDEREERRHILLAYYCTEFLGPDRRATSVGLRTFEILFGLGEVGGDHTHMSIYMYLAGAPPRGVVPSRCGRRSGFHSSDGGDAVTGKSKKKEAILTFVSDLRRRLPTDKDDSAASETLLRDVQKQNQLLDRYSDKPNHGMLLDEDLDTEGTKLWNVCTRLGRENADKPARSSAGLKLILWSRVLAFHILHLCQWSTKCTVPIASHLMELALRMARLCIDDNDVQNARTVLQKAADYHGRLQNLLRTMEPEDVNQSIEMEAEWTVLRIALAWRDNQLDVAEHLFAQANSFLDKIKPATSEKIIDIYFQIGKSMLSKEDFSMAEKWLQRAWDSLHGQRLQELPRDAVELRMAILQSLVTALLGLRTSESNERAQNLVTYVESEVGDRPIVLVLSLEILNRSPAEVFDSEAYGNILRRMIRSVQLSGTSFKLLAHHVRRLHSKSPGLGCTILDEFLISLIKSGQNDWIDKAVVTRIFVTTQRDFARSIDEAEKSLSRLEHPVSTDASFSAQTLIWKKIEANYSQGQYDMAERWCHLALSPAFANSGPLNHAKVQRKLLLCAMARNDIDSAKSTFFSMSQDAQEDPMTQYVMYKTTVRSGDRESAAVHLEAVAKASPAHLHLLYACVADSQQVKDRLVAIDALKKLANVYDFQHPGPVHLPALLRCTIMLLHGLLESGDEAQQHLVVADLCASFDTVAMAAQKAPEESNGKLIFDVRELEWFCQNSYNLGLKHAGDWSLQSVVRILKACVSIIQIFPHDIGLEVAADLSLKSIFCNFLISSALVALARSQDNLEEQLQDYLIMRRHIAAADSEIQKRMESQSLDEVASKDLLNKLALLLSFDFEAAVALKSWPDLGEIVLKAGACHNTESFNTMADCILRTPVPPEELFSVLRKIINEISALQDRDSSKLAKYTRCLFQAVAPSNDDLAGRLLDEACRMTSDAHGTPSAWPSEEIEWLASAAYNHSIDLWGRHERKRCTWWAQKAMSIAHFCDDEGHLEKTLQGKYANLKLDVDGN